MADVFSKELRSKIMSRIHSKNTKPEILLREALKGQRFRHQAKIFGRPDFSSKKLKIAIFVDGCFWHGCPKCYRQPKSNLKYWVPKIKRNMQRSKEVSKELRRNNWKVLRFWEHDILKNQEQCVKKILDCTNK